MRSRQSLKRVEDIPGLPIGGDFTGYGWPATIELLSPLEDITTDSRHAFSMIICPSCSLVHEIGGDCDLYH